MMETDKALLKGIQLKELPFKLHKVNDLFYFDGHILSHFKSDTGENYVYSWIDGDEKCNRWLIYKVDDVSEMLKSKLAPIDYIKENEIVYVVDIDENVNYINIVEIKTVDIVEYL